MKKVKLYVYALGKIANEVRKKIKYFVKNFKFTEEK